MFEKGRHGSGASIKVMSPNRSRSLPPAMEGLDNLGAVEANPFWSQRAVEEALLRAARP